MEQINEVAQNKEKTQNFLLFTHGLFSFYARKSFNLKIIAMVIYSHSQIHSQIFGMKTQNTNKILTPIDGHSLIVNLLRKLELLEKTNLTCVYRTLIIYFQRTTSL